MIRQRTVSRTRSAASFPSTQPMQNEGKTVGSCLDNVSLAMVYSPIQRFEELYSPEEALGKGTLFKKLYLPFHAGFRV